MKIKTAIFETSYGHHICLLYSEFGDYQEYVQMTEWTIIDFKELSKESVIDNKINAINFLIEEEKDRAICKMTELSAKKQELLALTLQV